jgi:acetamidase/formamidase
MMGDIHGAQGDGEIIGGAIETSGVIDCTIRLLKGKRITNPRVRDPEQIVVIASEGDLRLAIQHAYAGLVEWLASDFGMNRWDAYNVISQTGRVMLGGVGSSPYAAGAAVPLAALPREAVEREHGAGQDKEIS